MKSSTDPITRRTLLATAGLGAVAALASGPQAAEASPVRSPEEQANVKLVQDFTRGWTLKGYDAKQEMARYLSDPCVARPIDSQPVLTTPDGVAQLFIDFMKNGSRLSKVDFHQIIARGKVVVTNRDDIVKIPGKPDKIYKVIGVFVIQGGKIHEWTDFLIE